MDPGIGIATRAAAPVATTGAGFVALLDAMLVARCAAMSAAMPGAGRGR